ncbi:MAG: FAD:protein FMN transferase [Deltaproteobacteria bacterium]|nr:FAD:protein FMN transferase [Deltaproteobacteria bacterium]
MVKEKNLSSPFQSLDRRSFLKMSGILGMGLASAGIFPIPAEAVKFNKEMYKVSRTGLSMGTTVSMTLMHPSRDEAEDAMGAAFEEIDRLTGLMNRFEDNTAIGVLNREGILKDVNPEVREVVSNSLYYFQQTQGAFDISVKPIIDLFRETVGATLNQYPHPKALKEVLEKVGSEHIEFNGHTVRFKKPGMGITLDGIAKGYIVDKASKVLMSRNIQNHLINAGGDIRAMGVRQDKGHWTVAIQDPKKRDNYLDTIQLSDAAIATSGNYEVYFDREKMFHHIINPSTGHSPYTSAGVSVIAPTAMEADALSTSVFVMNPGKGTQFINSLPSCESFVITRSNEQIRSKGWKNFTV